MADSNGFVWWGKFGIGVSRSLVEAVKKQLKKNIPTYVYLVTGGSILYRARLSDLVGGGGDARYRAPEGSKVPAYYRDETCSIWFKLTGFKKVTIQEKMDLILYNEPAFKPQGSGMRGLVYVARQSERLSAK